MWRWRADLGSRRDSGRLRSVATVPVLQVTTPTPGVGPEELADYGLPLVRGAWFLLGFVVVLLVGWYVLVPAVVRVVRRRNRNNPTLNEALARYVRAVFVLLAVLVGAGVAGYGGFLSNSALVVAALTLALGVAGQEVIGSVVSGLALVVDPEFNVGDYIEWADGEGTVRSITLRVTRVQSPDGELVTIPNTVLTEDAITRPFGRGRYRVVDRVGLDYDEDVGEVMDVLEGAARDVEGILAQPSPEAFVQELADDAVRLRIHYWIEDPERRDVFEARSAYARTVKARLEAAGVDITPAAEHELRGRIQVDEPS